MTINIFAQATRQKLRFETSKLSNLSVEQLWELPLESKNGDSLDSMAVDLDEKLQKVERARSFVNRTENKQAVELQLKFDIVKYIIDTKLADREAAQQKANIATERARLLEAKERIKEKKYETMTEEDIDKQLAALPNS